MKKMKMLVTVCLIAVICLVALTAGGNCTVAQKLNFKGTVKYQNFEGGFWGIVADDGKNYDPDNLAGEFRQEGLRVQVEAVPNDRIGIHMWGTIVEITAITRLTDQKESVYKIAD